MQNDVGLGRLALDSDARDAVHIAVIPCEAGEEMKPGDPVCIRTDGKGYKWNLGGSSGLPVGVVDPFLGTAYPSRYSANLTDRVQAGARFWLLLIPGTITSLRHEWTHDRFPLTAGEVVAGVSPERKAAAEKILRRIADDVRMPFRDLVEQAIAGDGISAGSEHIHDVDQGRFWSAMQDYTGRMFDEGHRDATYFSCSC